MSTRFTITSPTRSTTSSLSRSSFPRLGRRVTHRVWRSLAHRGDPRTTTTESRRHGDHLHISSSPILPFLLPERRNREIAFRRGRCPRFRTTTTTPTRINLCLRVSVSPGSVSTSRRAADPEPPRCMVRRRCTSRRAGESRPPSASCFGTDPYGTIPSIPLRMSMSTAHDRIFAIVSPAAQPRERRPQFLTISKRLLVFSAAVAYRLRNITA